MIIRDLLIFIHLFGRLLNICFPNLSCTAFWRLKIKNFGCSFCSLKMISVPTRTRGIAHLFFGGASLDKPDRGMGKIDGSSIICAIKVAKTISIGFDDSYSLT